jgi:uncharacterized membrane protein YfcA
MDLTAGLTPPALAAALAITFAAGFVKGTVGFAMPMIMIAGLSSLVPPQVALAGLILPTLAANLRQALADGPAAAAAVVRARWRFLAATVALIPLSALLATSIPRAPFLLLLGVPIAAYAALLLSGRSLRLPLAQRARAEWGLGVAGGLYGGVSGIWGPPLLVYLLSTDTPKDEIIRVQGVVFLIGAVALLAAHVNSGVLNPATVGFSALLVLPGMAGLWLGAQAAARLNAARFRFWTQVVLLLTGLNLIRLALAG